MNLKKREVHPNSFNDRHLLSYIRRVNLDTFWSREPSTIAATLANLHKGHRLSRELGLDPIEFLQGPWPVNDMQGMQEAIELLHASQAKGKNNNSYIQFDSIRKLRLAYSNLLEASFQRCQELRVFKAGQGNILSMTQSPTDSTLFCMFILGCEKRMGRLVHQDLGISVEVLNALLSLFERELGNPLTLLAQKQDLVMAGAAFAVLFAGALRGGEVLLMEATEFVKRRMDGKNHKSHPHVIVPLMGRFKNETGERNVLLVLLLHLPSGLAIHA